MLALAFLLPTPSNLGDLASMYWDNFIIPDLYQQPTDIREKAKKIDMDYAYVRKKMLKENKFYFCFYQTKEWRELVALDNNLVLVLLMYYINIKKLKWCIIYSILQALLQTFFGKDFLHFFVALAIVALLLLTGALTAETYLRWQPFAS